MKKEWISLLLVMLCTFCNAQQPAENTAADTASKKTAKPKVKISGYIQVHYFHEFNTNSDTLVDAGGFRILRARLTASGQVNKYTSFELTVDPRAPEISGLVRDAWIGFHRIPGHEIRVGQQKTQFGYENPESSAKLYCVNRSEVSDNLSRGVNLRDIGIGLMGRIKINDKLRFEDAVTFVNGSGRYVAGPDDFNKKKNLWGRTGIRYKNSSCVFRFGLSGGIGDIKDPGDDLLDPADDVLIHFNRFGTDVQADHKYFFLAGEYVMASDKIADTVSDESGYYALLCGKTKWRAGPLVRYDVMGDEWKRWTAGIYYGLPNDLFRILVNYEYRGYKSEEFPAGLDDRLYVQLQVVFR